MAAGNALKTIERPVAGALQEIVTAEMDRQIATAHRYPRDVKACQTELKELATSSDDVAEACMYTLKRKSDGKDVFIIGPSVRFAELLVYAWGNFIYGARVIDEGAEFVTAQGFARDLQRNTGASLEVKRRITYSNGGRYSADMIAVTATAACSIAARNAVFDAIPEAVWKHIWEAAKKKATGKGPLKQRVDRAIEFFVKAGAVEAQIYPALGVETREQLGEEHLLVMTGLRNALKENQITIERMFHPDAREERARLNLSADDPADPSTPGTPIDGLLNKGKPAKEGGGSGNEAAAKADGDGGMSEESDKAKANPPSDPAGSAQEADAEDEKLVADLEARLDPAKALSSRKAVNANRGALSRIAETGAEALRPRATKILQDWPAK